MRFLLSSTALILLFISQTTLSQESKNCATIVKSAQEAANKADWIFEGDVVSMFQVNPMPSHIQVSIENAKVLYELEKSPRFFTAALPVDSCFPNAMTTLWGKSADKLIGKRMRFFGTKLSHDRSFFFMQPAEQAMPSFSATRKEYTDKNHAPITISTGPDGWSRARSTEGKFSVEMPGIFIDITKGSSKQPAFMLRGTDRYGATFMAVFERSGPGSDMGRTFDAMIEKPNAKVITFKGADALSTLEELPRSDGEKITRGLWFRVPGGTYMLGIVTDKAHEADSLKFKERFFNSLTFE